MEVTVADLQEIIKVVIELESVTAEVEKVWVGKHGVRLKREASVRGEANGYTITGIWTRTEAEGASPVSPASPVNASSSIRPGYRM